MLFNDTDAVLCRCLQVSQSQVVDCIAVTGAETVREVSSHCGAGSGCMACHCRIRELLQSRTAHAETAISTTRTTIRM